MAETLASFTTTLKQEKFEQFGEERWKIVRSRHSPSDGLRF